MRYYICALLLLCALSSQPITKTITIAGNNKNFTTLSNMRAGQVFIIESVTGYVSFSGENKLRDAMGKDQDGKLCNDEGGIVLLLPGGTYQYTPRDEARLFFCRFTEEVIGQKIHVLKDGNITAKAFDHDNSYGDNTHGSYQIKITIYPFDSKQTTIPIPSFHEELAFHWAPIHYQDCNKSSWCADAITKINYDGDWKADNNWDSLDNDASDLSGCVYYFVVETDSHWFINYSFYHPRDWKEPWDIETDHENDLEGILVLVQKIPGNDFGKLQGIITCSHLDFYSYITEASDLTTNQENIDGKLLWRNDDKERFCTYQEAKGHGCQALQLSHDFGKEDDYIIYYPSKSPATAPQSRFDRRVHYNLIHFFAPGELWERRFDPQVFKDFGVFLKSKGDGGNANTPWTWDDKDDGKRLKKGEMALDPALLFTIYYHVPDMSFSYTYNPFQGIW